MGGALNLNIHFHMLFLDGVYSANRSRARFRWVKAPTNDELTQLTYTIAQRIGRYLERQGLLVRDAGNSYLTAEVVDADSDYIPISTKYLDLKKIGVQGYSATRFWSPQPAPYTSTVGRTRETVNHEEKRLTWGGRLPKR